MTQIYFKKLLVASSQQKIAKEINFSKGINLIIGDNKTGKSSLIKSIFHTLGCKVSFEQSWIDLIDIFYIELKYESELYKFVRMGNNYLIFSPNDSEYQLYNGDKDFFSHFNKIFNINLEVTTKHGIPYPPSPALLFSFQYIDQDIGWSGIPTKFSNSRFYKDGYDMSIKYLIDQFPDKYFRKKKELNSEKSKASLQEKKIENINSFLESVFEKMESLEGYKQPTLSRKNNIIRNTVNDINRVKERISLLEKDIIIQKSSINQDQKILKLVSEETKEIQRDINFSNTLSSELTCPFCLTPHVNDLNNIFSLISDSNKLNKLKNELRLKIKNSHIAVDENLKQLSTLKREESKLISALEKFESGGNLLNSYKQKGIEDIIQMNGEILINEKESLESINKRLVELDSDIKELSSKSTSRKITNTIKDLFKGYAHELNLLTTEPKFRVFKPSLTGYSGSDRTRAIYAYYISIYQYIAENSKYPFKFLVVDTPNQQGQDAINLDSIFSVLSSISKIDGQFILASETITGYEDNYNTITLLNERNVLNNEDFNINRELITKLNALKQ